MSSESKLFTTITLDNIRSVLTPLREQQIPFYIITAESGYCPACHSDLSSANITAPNSLLGHLRRSKKCIAKREERRVRLFGLKQPDSLLWGSVDDLTALDSRRYPDRNLWVQCVFPPTRPPMTTPMYASVSQWHARTDSAEGGYMSSSPPPSSASSDDGWASSSASSSSTSSPSNTHFSQQYAAPAHQHPSSYGLYDPCARRESNSTISAAEYYAAQQQRSGQPMPSYPPVAPGGVPMTTGTSNQAYRMPASAPGMYQQAPPQGMYMASQQPQQQIYPPGYQYPIPPQGAQPGYSW
ncbi:hypothetical protein FRB99_000418 [Tulasnella sp. 403]|nr:hypothetical protein FRB99_000418 [Tulasnella sp. 403]